VVRERLSESAPARATQSPPPSSAPFTSRASLPLPHVLMRSCRCRCDVQSSVRRWRHTLVQLEALGAASATPSRRQIGLCLANTPRKHAGGHRGATRRRPICKISPMSTGPFADLILKAIQFQTANS
jgi:hypothetical protein